MQDTAGDHRHHRPDRPDGEKDLCLDVALRLGKIIQQKLRRRSAVHAQRRHRIPLERRTEIANEAKADLFISVHANSSRIQKQRAASKRIT